ncbi:GNAT family N-acetyltransferase [Actinoplanes sp. NPDC049596]|uniref:GNAT family N-acetyltransferase n=1 Tax=unclassified Actinoplanes TaxID=2626549 RepID=UPI00344850B1
MDDAEALAEVHVRTWQTAYRGLVPQDHLDRMDPSTRRDGWRRRIQDNPTGTLVLEDDDHGVAGFISVSPSRDADTDPRLIGEVQAIYVSPGHWDRGAGRLLMRAGLRRLHEAGFEQVILWALETNQRARRFYERGGWRLDGATKTDDSRGFPLVEVRYRFGPEGWQAYR